MKGIAHDLRCVHDTSAPGIHQSSGVAERAVRTIEDGARTALSQAGLPTAFWPYAVEHFSFALNISCRFSDEDSSWNIKHCLGQFEGPLIPFGAIIDFLPIPEVAERKPKFSPRSVPGIFLAYYLDSGGQWKGDYLVAELSEFEHVDFSRDGKKRPVKVQRVRDIVFDSSNISFPLKRQYDIANRTLH